MTGRVAHLVFLAVILVFPAVISVRARVKRLISLSGIVVIEAIEGTT
jgi:hypothetical protein